MGPGREETHLRTKTLKLWWVRKVAEGGEFLTDEPGGYTGPRPAHPRSLTAAALAEYLERQVESADLQHLAGVHAALADIVCRVAGPEWGRAILLAIARRGGLQALASRVPVAGDGPGG